MNKYQEALDYLRWIGGDSYYKKQREKSFDVLQELVDKATPMKPTVAVLFGEEGPTCPRCGVGLNPSESIRHKSSYCGNCGQKIDWRKQNENRR